MKAQIIGYVYSTTDYDAFKRLDGNRPVTEARKNKILSSIDDVGFVLNPLVINEKDEVVEGQGRLAALKERGLPVPFVIAEGAGSKECIAMNQNNTNWSTIDFINSFAENGNPNYVRFKKLLKQFPSIKIQEMHGIVRNEVVSAGITSRFLKSGQLVVTEEILTESIPICEWITKLNEVIKKIPGSARLKVTGLAWAIKNTSCNRTRLYDQLCKKWPTMAPAVDGHPDLFLKELSEIYNKGLAPKNCIDFDYEYTKFVREN